MKIVHFTPFAPMACGLYEAARDMVVADKLAGHEVFVVDVGTTINNQHTPGVIGKEDKRNGTNIVSADPIVARHADLLIAHSGVPDPWFSVCQTPMIWVLHGRPAACFKPEQFKRGHSYTLMADIATWPRVKVLLSFWPFHTKYWNSIISEEKLVCLPAPPIDSNRFNSNGPEHDFGAKRGKWNIVIADSWREDVDLFEITNGAIECAKNTPGVKFHFYGVENPLPPCWDRLLLVLQQLGALGDVWDRRPNIEEVYRAADMVLSPHRIVTRIIGEALSCGTPVIAARGCEFATWTCIPEELEDVASIIQEAISQLSINRKGIKHQVKEVAKAFSLIEYNKEMEKIYADL